MENINNALSLISKKKEGYKELNIKNETKIETSLRLGFDIEAKFIEKDFKWGREIINLLNEIEQKLKEQDHE